MAHSDGAQCPSRLKRGVPSGHRDSFRAEAGIPVRQGTIIFLVLICSTTEFSNRSIILCGFCRQTKLVQAALTYIILKQ